MKKASPPVPSFVPSCPSYLSVSISYSPHNTQHNTRHTTHYTLHTAAVSLFSAPCARRTPPEDPPRSRRRPRRYSLPCVVVQWQCVSAVCVRQCVWGWEVREVCAGGGWRRKVSENENARVLRVCARYGWCTNTTNPRATGTSGPRARVKIWVKGWQWRRREGEGGRPAMVSPSPSSAALWKAAASADIMPAMAWNIAGPHVGGSFQFPNIAADTLIG